MATNRDPRRGFLARWYRRLRWLRRLVVIGGLVGGVAKALQSRSGGGSAAIGGPGRSDGGPGGSGRPAPAGGSPGPRLAASTSAPSDDDTALSGSSAPAGVRTLVSVPPLVDDGDEGDATVAAVADVAVAAVADADTDAETDDGHADENGGSTAPLLTIVADTDTDTDAVRATGGGSWVPPLEGGECPPGYPVKANDNSGIYHVPGGRSYNRTVAERCYSSAEAAEADGYRPAKA